MLKEFQTFPAPLSVQSNTEGLPVDILEESRYMSICVCVYTGILTEMKQGLKPENAKLILDSASACVVHGLHYRENNVL